MCSSQLSHNLLFFTQKICHYVATRMVANTTRHMPLKAESGDAILNHHAMSPKIGHLHIKVYLEGTILNVSLTLKLFCKLS